MRLRDAWDEVATIANERLMMRPWNVDEFDNDRGQNLPDRYLTADRVRAMLDLPDDFRIQFEHGTLIISVPHRSRLGCTVKRGTEP